MANHHCSSLIGLLLSGSFDRLDREETCYRCLFIAQKHANVLQYKECKFSFISFLNSAFNSNFNSISMNPPSPLLYLTCIYQYNMRKWMDLLKDSASDCVRRMKRDAGRAEMEIGSDGSVSRISYQPGLLLLLLFLTTTFVGAVDASRCPISF